MAHKYFSYSPIEKEEEMASSIPSDLPIKEKTETPLPTTTPNENSLKKFKERFKGCMDLHQTEMELAAQQYTETIKPEYRSNYFRHKDVYNVLSSFYSNLEKL